MDDSKALEILRMIAPEFKPVKDEDVSKFLSICEPLVSKKVFGRVYDQALALLAAHRMKMAGYGANPMGGSASDGGAAAGFGLASVAEAGANMSFNTANINAGDDSWYALSPYGMEFLNLRRMYVVPITSAGER